MVKYDQQVIQKYAESLYSKANSIVAVWILIATFIGTASCGVMGLLVAFAIKNQSAILAGVLLGVGCGTVLGWAIGAQKALEYRFQAQLALCQAAIEQNTRRPVA